MQSDYIRARKHASNHRAEVLASAVCGCFHCLAFFSPSELGSEDWTDERAGVATTALCPKCGVDAVIGSASVVSLTPELLCQMQQYWFGA